MMEATTDFLTVTELSGDEVSQEQIDRISRRYKWAAKYCEGKDVVEVACGTGQGLGLLAATARSLVAGDVSESILAIAKRHYGNRLTLEKIDALQMPFPDQSKDVIVLFEALYYLPSAEKFFEETRRVLRPGGKLLIATANKDLYDFNPSPFSHRYLGVTELAQELGQLGFTTEFFGDTSYRSTGLRQRVLRPLKKIAVSLHLLPKTTGGKKWIKRLVFGELKPMPFELSLDDLRNIVAPSTVLSSTEPDKEHKVIFCSATKV